MESVCIAPAVNFEGKKEVLGLRIAENEGAKLLKAVYPANTGEAGHDALEGFGKEWNGKYPMVYRPWDQRRDGLGEFFKYPFEIRRAIYTANAFETLNYQLRKIAKNRSAFSTGDTIVKTLYLAIRNASEKNGFRSYDNFHLLKKRIGSFFRRLIKIVIFHGFYIGTNIYQICVKSLPP
jgi:transposase-like protein